MATFLTPNGIKVEVVPTDGKCFTLTELQGFVEGYIELVALSDGREMYINEEAKLHGLPINWMATHVAMIKDGDGYPAIQVGDAICGNAVILERAESDAIEGDDA